MLVNQHYKCGNGETLRSTVKPVLNGPFIKRNLSQTEIFSGPVTLGLKKMLNIPD
jgi:hypothetical protein